MLDVAAHIPDLLPVMLDTPSGSAELFPKHELHVSLASLRKLAGENPAMEAAMVCFLEYYLKDTAHELAWCGLTGEYYRCQKPRDEGELQHTIIGAAEIIGLRSLETAMRHALDTRIRLCTPHVTLLKSVNSPYGIGVNSPDDLAAYCTRDDTLGARIFR